MDDDVLLRHVRPHLRGHVRPFPLQPLPPDPLHLDLNEGPYGPTPAAMDAIREALPSLNRYPDAAAPALRAAIAARHGLTPEHVLLGSGSNPVMAAVMRAICAPGDEIAYPWPGFPAYELSATGQDLRGRRVPVRADGADDVDGLVAAALAGARLVVAATPSNPTSMALPAAAVRDLVDRIDGRAVVVLDEAYAEYADHASGGIELVRDGRPVAVARTFSKIFGLAGLRIGYALLPPPLARAVRQVQETFEFTQVSMVAALAALRHDAPEIDRRVAECRRVRAVVAADLAARGWEAYPSQANFLTARVPDPQAVVRAAFGQGVLLRGLAVYGDPDRVRITMPAERDLPRLLAALDAADAALRDGA